MKRVMTVLSVLVLSFLFLGMAGEAGAGFTTSPTVKTVPLAKEPIVEEKVNISPTYYKEPLQPVLEVEKENQSSDNDSFEDDLKYESDKNSTDQQQLYKTTTPTQTNESPDEETYLTVGGIRLNQSGLDDYWAYDEDGYVVVNKTSTKISYYKYDKLGKVEKESVYDPANGSFSDTEALEEILSGMDTTGSLYQAMFGLLKQAQAEKESGEQTVQTAEQRINQSQEAVQAKEEEIEEKKEAAKEGFFSRFFYRLFGMIGIETHEATHIAENMTENTSSEYAPEGYKTPGNITIKIINDTENYDTFWSRVKEFFAGRAEGYNEMDEVNDEVSVALQTTMGNRAKMIQTLSNILKAMQNTQKEMVDKMGGDDLENMTEVRIRKTATVIHILAYDNLGQVASENTYDRKTGKLTDTEEFLEMLQQMNQDEFKQFISGFDDKALAGIISQINETMTDDLLAAFMKLQAEDPGSDGNDFTLVTKVNVSVQKYDNSSEQKAKEQK